MMVPASTYSIGCPDSQGSIQVVDLFSASHCTIITTRGKYGGGIRVQIADGHKMLYEKMEREFGEVHEELDALNSTQAAQEFVLTRRLKQV